MPRPEGYTTADEIERQVRKPLRLPVWGKGMRRKVEKALQEEAAELGTQLKQTADGDIDSV